MDRFSFEHSISKNNALGKRLGGYIFLYNITRQDGAFKISDFDASLAHPLKGMNADRILSGTNCISDRLNIDRHNGALGIYLRLPTR